MSGNLSISSTVFIKALFSSSFLSFFRFLDCLFCSGEINLKLHSKYKRWYNLNIWLFWNISQDFTFFNDKLFLIFQLNSFYWISGEAEILFLAMGASVNCFLSRFYLKFLRISLRNVQGSWNQRTLRYIKTPQH